MNSSKQDPRKHVKGTVNTLSTVLLQGIMEEKQNEAKEGKAKRIINGMRNHNVPVDMGDDFYENGNEYCKYLITDPRSDLLLKSSKKVSK